MKQTQVEYENDLLEAIHQYVKCGSEWSIKANTEYLKGYRDGLHRVKAVIRCLILNQQRKN